MRGGKRDGAGRKAGAITLKTREEAERLYAGGILPLDVLVQTMRELWDAGSKMEACAIAEKAAPYMHAKLSAVEMNANVRRSISDYTDEELAALAGHDGGEDGDGEAGSGEE